MAKIRNDPSEEESFTDHATRQNLNIGFVKQ